MKTKTLKKNKVNVVTLGCAKNIFDSEIMMAQLKANAFDVEHDETIAGVGTSLKANNVTFSDITNKSKGKTTAGGSADVSAVFAETSTATGAGNGTAIPSWATGWTTGL